MKRCHGCNEEIWALKRWVRSYVLMADQEPMLILFHRRCFDSYNTGMATAQNNPRYKKGEVEHG